MPKRTQYLFTIIQQVSSHILGSQKHCLTTMNALKRRCDFVENSFFEFQRNYFVWSLKSTNKSSVFKLSSLNVKASATSCQTKPNQIKINMFAYIYIWFIKKLSLICQFMANLHEQTFSSRWGYIYIVSGHLWLEVFSWLLVCVIIIIIIGQLMP